MRLTLKELSRLVSGELEGDEKHVVTGAAGLREAGPADVSFLGNMKYGSLVAATEAGCVLVPRDFRPANGESARPSRTNCIRVDHPQWAFAQILSVIEQETKERPSGVHPSAWVHPAARLGAGVSVGPFTVVEKGARIGEGTVLGAQVYMGARAQVGKNCLIYPQVVVREDCVLGAEVIVHSGTVIGSDGYGFATVGGEHRKIPQIGNVVIEDNVEIGANVAIDRATVGQTRIGEGTKIDNLVQIAHNVQIGKRCLIVAQVGISGSTRVGKGAVLAGQVGIAGHITIGDGAVIAAQSGVMRDVAPGETLFGTPARSHRRQMKLHGHIGRLPEMFEALKKLQKKVEAD